MSLASLTLVYPDVLDIGVPEDCRLVQMSDEERDAAAAVRQLPPQTSAFAPLDFAVNRLQPTQVNQPFLADTRIVQERYSTWALFHKTSKTSLHRLTGLLKDVFMFYETEPWDWYTVELTSQPPHLEAC